MNTKERFYDVDLFRFIAAISVVFYHYTFRGYTADDMSILSFPLLGDIAKYGYLGVDLFFMISGFVILLTASNRDFSGFVVSRIARLYPAFWIGVTLTALVTIIIGGDRYNIEFFQYLANLSMISGFFGIEPVDGVYWTLEVEIKFYFLVAVVLLFNQIKNIKYYLFAWLLISMVCAFIEVSYAFEFFLLTKWSSYFIAGAFFYLLRKDGFSKLYVVGIALSYYLSVKHACWRIPDFNDHYQTELSPFVIIGILSVFYILMLLVSIRKTGPLNKRVMLHLGMLTYPLYLIHQNIGFMVFNYFGNDVNKYALLIITITMLLVVSYIISKYYEKWIAIRLKAIMLRTLDSIKPLTVVFTQTK